MKNTNITLRTKDKWKKALTRKLVLQQDWWIQESLNQDFKVGEHGGASLSRDYVYLDTQLKLVQGFQREWEKREENYHARSAKGAFPAKSARRSAWKSPLARRRSGRTLCLLACYTVPVARALKIHNERLLLSRGACHGFGTFKLNNSHRFLSGGIVYDSVISVFIPLKRKQCVLGLAFMIKLRIQQWLKLSLAFSSREKRGRVCSFVHLW